MLWFHEYDDLDVEVGELSHVEWAVHVKKEEDVNVNVKKEVNVKVEEKDW